MRNSAELAPIGDLPRLPNALRTRTFAMLGRRLARAGGEHWAQSARLPSVDESRLIEVEVRYSYLERLVEDLSHVFYEQQRLIDKMAARLERIESLIAESMDQSDQQLPHEKPPHY